MSSGQGMLAASLPRETRSHCTQVQRVSRFMQTQRFTYLYASCRLAIISLREYSEMAWRVSSSTEDFKKASYSNPQFLNSVITSALISRPANSPCNYSKLLSLVSETVWKLRVIMPRGKVWKRWSSPMRQLPLERASWFSTVSQMEQYLMPQLRRGTSLKEAPMRAMSATIVAPMTRQAMSSFQRSFMNLNSRLQCGAIILRIQAMQPDPEPKTLLQSQFPNISDFSRHSRVEYKKYLNDVNQTLQSLITAGKLKRNQLMSINNRALFNRGKVQRCEWLNRKKSTAGVKFLPDLSRINLDNRSPAHKKPSRRCHTESKNQPTSLIDSLIDQQMKKIIEQRLLENGKKKEDIVREACLQIEKTIVQKTKQPQQKASARYVFFNSDERKSQNHRRSVTDALYLQELQSLAKKEQVRAKERMSEQKSFYRRIKNVTSPSH